LSLNEVDAVLFEIGLALAFVKLEHGIKSIPFLRYQRGFKCN
jgi:hypothetical protein